MAASTDPQAHPAERLTVAVLGWTWGLWLVGGLYLAGPALGWVLLLFVCRAAYFAPALPACERPAPLPGWLVAWVGGMIVMLIALLVGHAQFELGLAQTVKSSIGWAKGWALLALFPLAGFLLPIRTSAIARATCRVGALTLALLPVFLIAPALGLPQTLWISPLKVLGGSGDEYFSAILYTIDPGSGLPRWQFFAPWSPAAGLVGVIHFFLAGVERQRGWRMTGQVGALVLILLSQSRLAVVALVMVSAAVFVVRRIDRPLGLVTGALALTVAGWFGPGLIALTEEATTSFTSARADSSRVRAALGRIALERWQNEAYWFGHGIVVRGPHLVEYMPIGSHHSWFGLLFVKGLAGLLALAVPMILTLGACVSLARREAHGALALAVTLTLWLFSFGENLEVVGYLIWPGLLAMGTCFRPVPTRD